ncbi:MAG: hypothetical protein ACRC1P_10285 [Cellulosilyticaceae bacterium]
MFNFEELNALAFLCEEKINQLKQDEEDTKPWRELLVKVREERDGFVPLLPKDY